MKKSEQIGIHVTLQMKKRLDKVATFEGVDLPELIRSWIREKLAAYRIPKSYNQLKKEP
ncbi:hypothetical protein ES703_60536 [subsurface metagenome]